MVGNVRRSACAGAAGARAGWRKGHMAASAMTPTISPVTATIIVVSTVLVDRFENRCRPALEPSSLSSAIPPRTQTASAMERRRSSISVSISWASRPTIWRPLPALVRSSPVFLRTLTVGYIGSNAAEIQPICDTTVFNVHSNKVG